MSTHRTCLIAPFHVQFASAGLLQGKTEQHAELHHTSGHGKHALAAQQQQQDSGQEFKYTLGAARRTELRRLRNFVRMADYMMCDTLQQVTPAEAEAVLPATDLHSHPDIQSAATSHITAFPLSLCSSLCC